MAERVALAVLLAFSLTVTPTTVTLRVGESAQLSTVPSHGVQFSSADPTIAGVTRRGLVVGISAGTVTIVARKGNETASVQVRVSAFVPSTTGVGAVVAPLATVDGVGLVTSRFVVAGEGRYV